MISFHRQHRIIFLLLSLTFLAIILIFTINERISPVSTLDEIHPLNENDYCQNKSGHLVNFMRFKQTLLTTNWAFQHRTALERWRVIAEVFGVSFECLCSSDWLIQPTANDFKYHFRTFTYWADDEFKYWLDMRHQKFSCNMITVG